MQFQLFPNLPGRASPPPKRRRTAAKTRPIVVTVLTPLACPDGLFPAIPYKTRTLASPALKAHRWPPELRLDGAPFAEAREVWRVAGRWQARCPSFQGGVCPYLRATVQRLEFPREK